MKYNSRIFLLNHVNLGAKKPNHGLVIAFHALYFLVETIAREIITIKRNKPGCFGIFAAKFLFFSEIQKLYNIVIVSAKFHCI